MRKAMQYIIPALIAAVVLVVALAAAGCTTKPGDINITPDTPGVPDPPEPPRDANPPRPTYSVQLDRWNTPGPDAGVSRLPLGVYYKVVDFDAAAQTLTVHISNESGYEMPVGAPFSLEQYADSTWTAIAPLRAPEGPEPVTLADLAEADLVFDISCYPPLDEGKYRFLMSDTSCEFTLYREWTE